MGMERINADVSLDLSRRFKAACALRGVSHASVIRGLILRWLEEVEE